MKRLYLLRHAKTVPGGSDQSDQSRELMVRGMHDAAALARYLRKNGYIPAQILVSTAMRTRQTAELVMREVAAKADFRDALYLAEPGKILAMVQALPAGLESVMVIGHNPGMEALASLLAREPVRRKERARRDVLEEKFPTAALAVLDFDIAKWPEIQPGEGRLIDFVRPKDL